MNLHLHGFDIVIINSSGGKDSVCAIHEICRMADEQKYPREQIHVSHQDLGEIEWPGVKELVERQCKFFNLQLHITTRKNRAGDSPDLLDYALRRKMWPGPSTRWCTSDFKRGPGARVVTKVAPKGTVLYVFGFREIESPRRKKMKQFSLNKRLSNKGRTVYDCLPIHRWEDWKVWATIKGAGIPYHYAYDLGMPRLSCVFCIYAPFDALVLAGRHNEELLKRYVAVEQQINHTFRIDFSMKDVHDAVYSDYQPKKIESWKM